MTPSSANLQLDTIAPAIIAMSADGEIAVCVEDGIVRVREGAALIDANDVVAAEVLAGAIWIVTRSTRSHALHRFAADGTLLAAPLALGALGDDVAITAARTGARTAMIQGARAIEVREGKAGDATIVPIGARTADRFVYLPGKGVLERRGLALVTTRPSAIPTLAIPVDASRSVVVGGALVIDGAAAMIELAAHGKRQIIIYDLRQGTIRSRVRLGDARIVAIAEKRGVVVLGRGPHLATLDLRGGRCTNERILAAPLRGVAIDADAKRVLIDDGAVRILGAALTELRPAPEPEPASEPVVVIDQPPAIPEAPIAPVAAHAPPQLSPADHARYLADVYELVTAIALTRALDSSLEASAPAASRIAKLMTGRPVEADARTVAAFAKLSAWNIPGAPHVEIGKECGLSRQAQLVLLVVAAPQVWSEAARAFAALGTPGRPLLDETLLGELLGTAREERQQLAAELDDAAPLVKDGLIVRAEGPRMFAALSVHEGVIARLRGSRTALVGSAASIAKVADPVPTVASWGQLVVPDEIDARLRELVGRIRLRDTVLDSWGLGSIARTRGVTALFRGEPGTGKSLAASVIAGALGLPLYRVDLSRVLSKWIGETERNLGAVLDAAETGAFVLLFDEADSLFGKRTEVESSNDRYANLEVNYLLQRLDRFDGLAILTTNHGTSIDPAFQRRLTCELQFPSPDETARLRLWQAHLPASVPTEGDLGLAKLAAEFPLSGGYIRNAALRGCYLAAAEGAPVRAAHLRRAVELEYESRGKLCASGALV